MREDVSEVPNGGSSKGSLVCNPNHEEMVSPDVAETSTLTTGKGSWARSESCSRLRTPILNAH